jgi:hypothetical protein
MLRRVASVFVISCLVISSCVRSVCSILARASCIWSAMKPAGRNDGEGQRPRTYRFIVDYNSANTRGEMAYRQRLSGEVTWKNVTHTDAAGPTAKPGLLRNVRAPYRAS